MFETIITKAISIIITVAISFAGMFGYAPERQFGATIPVTIALFETSLSAKITSTATAMTLVVGTDKSGDALSGYMCFILDEGSASEEFVCGTAAGTAISSMIRGIDPIDGDLEVSALKKSHRRGSSVKATNYPQLAIISRILNGDETLPNFLTYATSAAPTLDAHIANKKYIDDIAIAGSPDITYSTKGIAELATTSELLAGTATGTTGAYLVAPNDLFNATSSATTLVPVTGTDGKLSQGFLDLTDGYTWTGSQVFNTSAIDANVAADISGILTMSGANIVMADHSVTGLDTLTFTDTAGTIAGIANGNLVDKSATEAITGNWTLSGTTVISGGTTLSGTITQSGATTFSVIPELPASDPTTGNQAVRKSYTDTYCDNVANYHLLEASQEATLAEFQANAGTQAVATVSAADINNNNTAVEADFSNVNAAAEVNFDKIVQIRKWRQYGHANNAHGNGTAKIQYYNNYTHAWVDWVTGIVSRTGSWSTLTTETVVVTDKIRVVITAVDTANNKYAIGELEIYY